MAKKINDSQQKLGTTVIAREMQDIMHESMMTYAEYVLLDRALPRVEDGLKPVQRRILYTMYELSLTPDKPHRKCARIVGDCLGKYHPHGDTSVYDATVRMGQWFNMGVPTVDGQGNFGNIDGDPAAAMRYTEARMTPAAMNLLEGIDEDTVDFGLNFDDTQKEPLLLPCRFPNLLVNGATGIAVGLATSIPTHHPVEAIDAALLMLKDPDATVNALMKKMPGPDFPTGGILIPGEGLKEAYNSGRGKATLRAAVEIERDKNGRTRLIITEVPYQVKKANLLEKIVKVGEDKKELGIWDVRDESDRTGMRAVVELKKDVDPDWVLHQLYRNTDLQVTVSFNMVVIQDGKPKQLGLRDILTAYINHQRNVVTRRTQYRLDQALARAHILEGYIIAVDNIDEVVKLIRSSKNTKEARERLMERFGLSQIQAQAVLDMPLRRLTALEIEDLRAEYAQIMALIEELRGILADDTKLVAVIAAELMAIRKTFTFPRRTRIEDIVITAPAPAAPPLVREEPCVVILAPDGYIKRVSLRSYQRAAGEEQTEVTTLISTFTHHKLFGVTNTGNLVWVPVSAIPEVRARDRGGLLANFCGGFDKDEVLIALLAPTPEEVAGGHVLFYTAYGNIKRTALADMESRKNKLAGVAVKDGDTVVAAHIQAPDADVLMISSSGQCIRFDPVEVPVQGRVSGGVRGMQVLYPGALCFGGQVVAGQEIMAFTDAGYAKRMPADDFEPQNRGGKGVKAIEWKKNDGNGKKLVAAFALAKPTSFTLTQKDGMETRVASDAVLVESRTGSGSLQALCVLGNVVVGVSENIE